MSGPEADVRFEPTRVPLDGRHVIEASAGTGKTHCIVSLYLRFVVERGLLPSQIALVTFTEAATAELRDRVRQRLLSAERRLKSPDALASLDDELLAKLLEKPGVSVALALQRVRAALEHVDESAISTIHGLCQRILRDHALVTRVDFDAELHPELNELMKDVLFDLWHEKVAGSHLAASMRSLRVGPEALRELIRTRRQHPGARLVPPISAVDPEAVARAYQDARASYALLDVAATLKQNFKLTLLGSADQRRGLLEDLEGLFLAGRPRALRDADLLFCERLRAASKKAKAPTEIHPFFSAFERMNRLVWQQVIELEHQLLKEADRRLGQRKDRLRVVEFDDLLSRVHAALLGPSGTQLSDALASQYRAVLVDEFQDTDPTQFEILGRAFGREHPVYLVGDPKQAIYGFRGADVFTYLTARRQAVPQTLDVNWRSDPGLISAIGRLFARPGAFGLKAIEAAEIRPRPGASETFWHPDPARARPFEILFVERSDEDKPIARERSLGPVARVVAADIAEMLEGDARLRPPEGERAIRAADIAVLVRTHSQGQKVQQALESLGIPSVTLGTDSVFDTEEAEELLWILVAVAEPSRTAAVRRALLANCFGLSSEQIEALRADAELFHPWDTRFARWHSLFVDHGFMRMFRDLFAEVDVRARLLSRPGGERRLTNFLHLGELLHCASQELSLGATGICAWLAEQCADTSSHLEQGELRLETDADSVRILTVHKAKGLQFPVVYCPYLYTQVPRDQSRDPLVLHGPDGEPLVDIAPVPTLRTEHLERATWEAFCEELRLTYVALTRAEHKLTLLWGNFSGVGGSAGAWLLHPDSTAWADRAPDPKRLAKCSDQELQAQVRRLVSEAENAVGVRTTVLGQPLRRPRAPQASRAQLQARVVPTKVGAVARNTSFTGLVGNAPWAALDSDEPLDRDQTAVLTEEPREVEKPTRCRERPGRRIALSDFPPGRATGELIHELLEELDFSSPIGPALAKSVQLKLTNFGLFAGLDSDALQARVDQAIVALERVLGTELPGVPGLRLGRIASSQRKNELEFRMPVGWGASERRPSEHQRFCLEHLVRAFREHPGGSTPPAYAEHLAEVEFYPLYGYLHGYMDLVFCHNDRFYLVDYKTNNLGDFVEDYDAARMTRAMSHSHYFLQYHLYLAALDLYLERWLPGYEYGRNFGGVYYLFVKGMHPESPGTGVFSDRPPEARVRALRAALQGSQG